MLSSDFIPTSDNIDGSEIVIRFLTRKEDFANIDGIEYVAVHAFYPVLQECEFPDKRWFVAYQSQEKSIFRMTKFLNSGVM